ncbi:MAG: transposase [Bacteroidetes bacterium]|nr:transposase [Bacteroidota bacterium]
MSTKTRHLASTDVYFHVYNRGVNHSPIFFSPLDYQDFLERTKRTLQRETNPETSCRSESNAPLENPAGTELIAFCLMPNHFHFIVHQLAINGVSDLIGRVCNGYVKAINLKMHRTGHLFEGKYKIRLIDSNRYLLHLSRYIHLNPVRARLVTHAESWPYSSCGTYYRQDKYSFVRPEVVLGQFRDRIEYREFVESYKEDDKGEIMRYLFT